MTIPDQDLPATALHFAEGHDGQRQATTLKRLREWLREPDVLRQAPDLVDASKVLGLSTRVLQRRLADMGTTYKAEILAARRDVAERELVRGAALREVSSALGYADMASFFRFFRTWTGSSPRKWARARRQDQT